MNKIISPLLIFFVLAHSLAAQVNVIDSLRQVISSSADSVKVNALVMLADHLGHSDPKEAIVRAREACDIAEKISYLKGFSKACDMAGIAEEQLGNYSEALSWYMKAMSMREKQNDRAGLANSINNVGVIYFYLENYPKAIEYYEQALAIHTELGDNGGIATALANLAIMNDLNGNKEKSLEHYLEALKLFQELKDHQSVASIYSNMGILHESTGHYGEALAMHNLALEMQEKLNDRKGVGVSLMNIGKVLMLKRDFNAARSKFEKALEIAREVGSKSDQKNVYNSLAECHAKMNDFEKAYGYHQLFAAVKDSLFGEESHRQIAEMQVKYESEKKEKEIALLNKDNELKSTRNNFLGGIIGLLAVGGIFVFNAYRNKQKANQRLTVLNVEISRQKEEIALQKEIVEEKNRDITDSIAYARRIQNAVLPTSQYMQKMLKEHFVLYRPRNVISGDFYWTCMHNGSVLVAVADSTGHNVPGAFLTMIGNSLLNEIVIEKRITRPELVLNHLRDGVIKALNPEGAEDVIKDGMDITLLNIDLGSLTMQYATAIHHFYVIRNHSIIEYSGNKFPVGKDDREGLSFTLHALQLEKGDCIYAFTDGYADQFGGASGKKFKYSRLKQALLDIHLQPMQDQQKHLDTVFEEWRGNLEQVDDVLLIGIRV